VYRNIRKRGSVTDHQFAGYLEESRMTLRLARDRWSWPKLSLQADLSARGVDQRPTYYPWRDHAEMWIPIIRNYVEKYVYYFYKTNSRVEGDDELRDWCLELQSEEGGNLLDFPSIRTLEDLIDALTQFLFLAGPGHAAIHFPLPEFLGWAPFFPR